MTVSAPKDVSILYALGDERTRSTILRIHGEGVQAAAEYLQANAGWARQYNPDTKTTEAVRAKLVMPEFVHRTARPVTDPATGIVTVDPQLHTHITVPTWVQRPDGSWSQLHSEPLYQHAAAAGAIAQAEWRDRLVRELGISTVVDGKGCFSIVGITDAQRREFSRRSLQIDAAAAAYDVTTRVRARGGHPRHPRGQARGRGHRGSLRPMARACRERRARRRDGAGGAPAVSPVRWSRGVSTCSARWTSSACTGSPPGRRPSPAATSSAPSPRTRPWA